MPLKKYRNEKSLKEDFKYLKPILQMRTRPSNFLERKSLRDGISTNSQFLIKRQAFVYEYVSNKYYELKYSKITSDIFSRTRKFVDGKIGDLVPLSAQKFASVYENLTS